MPKASEIMKGYNENDFSDEETPIIDELGHPIKKLEIKKPKWQGGGSAKELLDWAVHRRGKGFNNPIIQYGAMRRMKANGYTPDQIKERWTKLEEDKYWSERLDFNTISRSFDKKP